jgi:hypothetical protein
MAVSNPRFFWHLADIYADAELVRFWGEDIPASITRQASLQFGKRGFFSAPLMIQYEGKGSPPRDEFSATSEVAGAPLGPIDERGTVTCFCRNRHLWRKGFVCGAVWAAIAGKFLRRVNSVSFPKTTSRPVAPCNRAWPRLPFKTGSTREHELVQ